MIIALRHPALLACILVVMLALALLGVLVLDQVLHLELLQFLPQLPAFTPPGP